MTPYEDASGQIKWAREVAVLLDPLLAEVWAFAWSSEETGEETPVAVLLRLAYLQGYRDALEEPLRGTLFQKLGVEVPPLKGSRRPAARRTKGTQSSSGS